MTLDEKGQKELEKLRKWMYGDMASLTICENVRDLEEQYRLLRDFYISIESRV